MIETKAKKRLVLRRLNMDGKLPTRGYLELLEDERVTLTLHTLELPWRGNRRNESCVPIGVYSLKWTYSPGFRRRTWELTDVPGRDGIRIHPANYIRELRGCIAPGMAFVDIDGDGVMDVSSSRLALNMLEGFLHDKEGHTVKLGILPPK